jgi:thioredoxin 1
MGNVFDANGGDWEQEVLKSEILMVVDFWHDRCPWCLRLNPTFNEASKEYKSRIEFFELNVLEIPANRDIAIRHEITSTPTLMSFCEGRSVGQALGFMLKNI